MHPAFILPLWAVSFDLPAPKKRTIRAQLNKALPTFEDIDVFKIPLLHFTEDSLMRVQVQLCAIYPVYHTFEMFAQYLYPKLNKNLLFDFFYENAPLMRIFILKTLSEDNSIYFGNSKLHTLPAEIGALQELTSIDVRNSKIGEVPESFYNLKNLRGFYYEKCPFDENKKGKASIKKRMPILEASRIFKIALDQYYPGSYHNAKKIIKQVVMLYPADFEFWRWYGEIHRMAEEPATAMMGLEKALSMNPKDGFTWAKLAEIKCKLNLHDEALAMCETFLQNPAQFEQGWRDKSDILFVKGLALFWLKRYHESIAAYQKSNALRNYAGCWYNLACLYSKKGMKSDTLTHLRKTFEMDWENYHKFCLKDKDISDFYEDVDFKELLQAFRKRT